MNTQENKMQRLRIIQNVPGSLYALYIVDNFLEEKYHKEILKKVKDITKEDVMNNTTNVQRNFSGCETDSRNSTQINDNFDQCFSGNTRLVFDGLSNFIRE